jgi:hypothetical protein
MRSTTSPRRARGTVRRPLSVEQLEGRVVPSFGPARSLPVGGLASDAVVGRFNGDGIPDIAVIKSDSYASQVGVMLGKGNGTFQAPRFFQAGAGSRSLVVGEFNGDGRQDLAVGNFSGPAASVLLGNGDGTFQAPRNFFAGSLATSLVVGDFNGDRRQDLAVSHYSGVSMLLGNGDGSFQPARWVVRYYAAVAPSMAAGDFNRDGRLDLVAGSNSAFVTMLLGNGDGAFQPARQFRAGGDGTRSRSVAVGDVNGDGRLDLAVANSADPYSSSGQSSVSVLLGNGDGSFRVPRFFQAGDDPTDVAVGDFNRDGRLDLAVATRLGDHPVLFGSAVSVLLGNGDGSFRAAGNYATGDFPLSVAVGDLNGDGWNDLVTANWNSGDVSVLLNDRNWAGR